MPIGDSTQLLSKEASVELLADMLKQAEDDKATLLKALRDVIDELRAIKDLEVTVSAATAIMRASIVIKEAS